MSTIWRISSGVLFTRLRPADAGVVDQHVDRAEGVVGARHHVLDLLAVGDVGGYRECLSAVVGDRACPRFEPVRASSGQHHPAAAPSSSLAVAAPMPALAPVTMATPPSNVVMP